MATVPVQFWRRVVLPNRWRYLIVIAACFVYAFGLAYTQPRWYKAEATLVFKNRTMSEQLDATRLSTNPLPIFLEEAPIEQTYDLTNLIYSINLAKRVIGDRFDELYDPAEFNGLIDFYEKFLMQAGFEYDGDKNVVRLSYTWKDPELAAEFCNAFADRLEDFMYEQVQKTYVSPMLRARLESAREDAKVAEEEVKRISELYGVPDLLESPKEWIKTYAESVARSYKSEAEVKSILAALRQIRETKRQRNLLEDEPRGAPDTTISKDLITAGLRFRLSLLKAISNVSSETAVEGTPARERIASEIAAIEDYLSKQYTYGIDVESKSLLIMLQEKMVENYLYQARADATYSRLESLPMLEKEVRPSIRAANVANGTVAALERLSSLVEVGEEYGIHPIRVIDPAVAPEKPIPMGWNTLMYVLPTMLFLATLWFALTVRLVEESKIQEMEKSNLFNNIPEQDR